MEVTRDGEHRYDAARRSRKEVPRPPEVHQEGTATRKVLVLQPPCRALLQRAHVTDSLREDASQALPLKRVDRRRVVRVDRDRLLRPLCGALLVPKPLPHVGQRELRRRVELPSQGRKRMVLPLERFTERGLEQPESKENAAGAEVANRRVVERTDLLEPRDHLLPLGRGFVAELK